jgi:hypothetical protein
LISEFAMGLYLLLPVGSPIVELFLDLLQASEEAGEVTPQAAYVGRAHLYRTQAAVRSARVSPVVAASMAEQIYRRAQAGFVDAV